MGSSVRRLKPSATWLQLLKDRRDLGCNFHHLFRGIQYVNIINTCYIYLEGAKWFDSQRVSIRHLLRFNWQPLEGASHEYLLNIQYLHMYAYCNISDMNISYLYMCVT